MSISDLGRTLADFSVTHLSALRGVGMSRLVFSLQIDVHPTPEYTVPLSGLMGYVYVGNSQSDVRALAALSVETIWFTATHSQNAGRDYVAVYCDLTADQLAALETQSTPGQGARESRQHRILKSTFRPMELPP